MKISALLILCVLIFNGCAQKLFIKCDTEFPERLYNGEKCGHLTDDKKFVECVIINDVRKMTDYDNLKAAFESCK
ncbi:MAG: hypothetical protein LBB59_04480 [Campylobacteraceae bacterium]|jgi:hypothetical protein|nr:hypothetical protein [Campylobacteraceae bacterium]